MYVWWKVSAPISKIEKKIGKLIRDILKKNTSKLIKTGGSSCNICFITVWNTLLCWLAIASSSYVLVKIMNYWGKSSWDFYFWEFMV